MRGFAFSIDMVLAAVGVVVVFLILIQGISPPPVSHALGPILAKDATMAWVYGAPQAVLVAPLPDTYFCDKGFHPRVTSSPLDPTQASSWIDVENCVVTP